MPHYIAFLRAVNVGGRYAKMADVRDCLSVSGFGDVESYIQSGNVRMCSESTGEEVVTQNVETALSARFGFEIAALVRTPVEVAVLMTLADDVGAPLPGDPRRYITFLRQPPAPAAAAALDGWNEPHERAQVIGREVLTWLTIGANEAKLTNARVQRLAATPATTRDIKVVRTLAEKWCDWQPAR